MDKGANLTTPLILLGLFISSAPYAEEHTPKAPTQPTQPTQQVAQSSTYHGRSTSLVTNDLGNESDELKGARPKSRFFIEPSINTANSSSTSVAIEGFSVVPAIVIGLINVSQVQRDTITSAVSLRYAIANRFDVSLKLPYVYREETVRQREALKGTPVDSITTTKGDGLGDIEAALSYRFDTQPGANGYWLAGVQIKSRTGTDPFEIQQRTLSSDSSEPGSNDSSDSDSTGVIYDEQATGSGFWGVQPSLTYIHLSDPTILYGSINYLYNRARDVGDEFGGTIDPGDAIGVSFGIGAAINNTSSFNIGYSHSTVKRSRIENDINNLEPSFSRFQVGSLKLGVTKKFSATSSFKLSLGIGVTEAAPDLQLFFSLPFQLTD